MGWTTGEVRLKIQSRHKENMDSIKMKICSGHASEIKYLVYSVFKYLILTF